MTQFFINLPTFPIALATTRAATRTGTHKDG
jgi:hypothetical protein